VYFPVLFTFVSISRVSCYQDCPQNQPNVLGGAYSNSAHSLTGNGARLAKDYNVLDIVV